MNEQVQKSSSATEKAKNKLSKKLVKEASTKKSWKTILKQVFKIAFNTSAIVGVITVGSAGAMRLLPDEAKDTAIDAVMDFESPIEKLVIGEWCVEDQWASSLSNPGIMNDRRAREVCMTRPEYTGSGWSLEFEQALYEASNKEMEYRFSNVPTSEMPNAIKVAYEGQCGDMQYFDSDDTLDDIVEKMNQNREHRTCDMKTKSDFIYEWTGKRFPYYDYVNRTMVYGEEQ